MKFMKDYTLRPIGFVIGVASNDLELSVTISALYSVTTNLFGGFYSSVIPSWLTWVKYLSIVHYAFHNMQIIEIKYGPPIRCSPTESILPFCIKNNGSLVDRGDVVIPPNIILEHLDPSSQQPFPIWLNSLILLLFLFIFQIFGYLVLRFFRKPK
ncbi:ATP-binding cassette subfamily G member 4-like [Brevipalpus obovatus]|uniref:ATP-binding cassette subfamily G member 4-like n=1 Tax=Brevipalpus obovatus TaxID=246614 RepID=UPI003D9EE62D